MLPGQQITQAAWDLHRTELRKLYLEKEMSLNVIRTEMDKKYGFCPSKSQYETAFKKWNFRKNLSRSDWEFVGHRIKKGKADDKETEVYLNGSLIPPKRVKKELDRHFTPSYAQLYTTAPSPQTPQDIAVQTPKNPVTFEIRLDNLPWFQFQEMFESHTGFIQDLVARMFNAGEHRVRTPFVDLPVFPDMAHSTGSALGFSAQEDPLQLESRANMATPAISSVFAGLTPSSIKQGSVEYIPTVHSCMQAILPERNQGDFLLSIQKLLGPFNCDALTEFLKFAAYLSSNMLSEDQSDGFLRWVIEANNHSTLREFCSVKMPTIEAFTRCIFESALRIGDAAVVRILLKAGVDPGPPTRMNGKTPLQVVVGGRNIELARILLDEGVDVNALSSYSQETALHIAVSKADVEIIRMLLDAGADVNHVSEISVLEVATDTYKCLNSGFDVQVVRILLNAGADVETPVYSYSRRTALQAAAESSNIEPTRLLLSAGADVNAPAALFDYSGDSVTVLQKVAGGEEYELSIELTRLLLDAGADINAPASLDSGDDDADGITALQGAAWSGSVVMVQMLLDAGADVNAPASVLGNVTALQAAVDCGSVAIVQMLLDAGADVNAPAGKSSGEFKRLTALERAAQSGSVELVQMLLDAGADANAPGCSTLSSAARAKQHNMALVRVLIAAGADVNDKGRPLIIAAAENDHIDLVRFFLAAGANVNAMDCQNQTALEVAIKQGHNVLVQVLLDAGADVNAISPKYGRAVLWAAVKKNDIDLVRKLLYAGAKVDVSRGGPSNRWVTNALPLAVEKGNIGVVQLLIGAGADVNASADLAWISWLNGTSTALLSAVQYRNVELVKILLNAGANVNARPQPSGGSTALQEEARSGNTELVRILLDAGADINAPAYYDSGRTALQAAVIRGHTELAQRLLEAGADANTPAAERYGVTALQGAAIKGQFGIALMLIQAGADPNAPPVEYRGRTALEGAAEHGRLDMVQLLLNAGADISGRHPARARELAERNGHAVIAEFLKRL